MLYIHYNQTKPNQTAFEYAIQGNNNVDVVCFDIKEIELGFEPTHIYVKVQSKDKKYIDKIMFKGEFLRVKFGKDGFESKAYLEYYKNNKLVDKKQIRSDRYEPQYGIIYEGTEDLIEGFVIPENQDLKINGF